jgi:hypothetical protein
MTITLDPAHHWIYPRDETGRAQEEIPIVSIDLDDVEFAQP